MKILKPSVSNLVFFIILVLFLIPQTRMQMKVDLNRIISKINPITEIDKNDQKQLSNYEFTITGINAPNENFKSFKNEVIFINYWATWCPPCVAEMPAMQKLYNKLQNEVNFVFVTTDKSNIVTDFLKNNNYSFPVYHINNKLPQEIDYTSLPTTLVIDKEGNIIVKKVGAADWNSKKVHTLLENSL